MPRQRADSAQKSARSHNGTTNVPGGKTSLRDGLATRDRHFNGVSPPGTFRYPSWIPGGLCGTLGLCLVPWDLMGPYLYEYLLIIHVRKKSAAWRKVPPRFLCPGVPPAGFEGDWVGLRRSWDSRVIGLTSVGGCKVSLMFNPSGDFRTGLRRCLCRVIIYSGSQSRRYLRVPV